jgi:hypothetical protein
MIQKIDVSTIKFQGFARVIMFPEVDPETFTSKTTLAEVLAGGKDLGQIVEDSYSWTGDATSVETLKDTEGNVIKAKAVAGTLAWECRIPSVSSAMSKTIAGAKITKAKVAENGDIKIDTTKDIIGLDPDSMLEYTLSATAEDIDAGELSTMMIIPLAEDPTASESEPAEEQSEG